MEIRKIDAAIGTRLETGPVQVNQDWPGVFIRGDNAAYYSMHLRAMLDGKQDAFTPHVLEGLYKLLQGCHI